MRRCAGAAAVLAGGAVALTAALPPALARSAEPAGSCLVTYRVVTEWSDGFVASVTLRNDSAVPWSAWRLGFSFADGQKVRRSWPVTATQSGAAVTVSSASRARPVPAGGSTEFGFVGTRTGRNSSPLVFTVNDRLCGPTVSVTNPFAGAAGYVNPDWAANVNAQAATTGGPQSERMAAVARQPTAVWLDSIASITAGRGLRGHLDAALLQQRAAGRPVVVTLVLYNLPVRACLDATGGGELGVGDLPVYRTGFIDPVAAILADPRYAALRVAVVVEPQSLADLAQDPNDRTARCAEAKHSGSYTQGVAHALSRLHPVPNVFAYLDVAGAGRVGWDSTQAGLVELLTQVAAASTGGLATVDGFASNVGDYVPVTEPFLRNGQTVAGVSIRQSRFLDWNSYVDEASYTTAMSAALAAKGFGRTRMLIDTSRNGWGGPARPTAASGSTDVNRFVDESRVDRRPGRYQWCNQAGAGLGARPQADPASNVDAYVWIKPPGESDGSAGLTIEFPEPACDPLRLWPPFVGWATLTNALPGAPDHRRWFPEHFAQLVENAHPAL